MVANIGLHAEYEQCFRDISDPCIVENGKGQHTHIGSCDLQSVRMPYPEQIRKSAYNMIHGVDCVDRRR